MWNSQTIQSRQPADYFIVTIETNERTSMTFYPVIRLLFWRGSRLLSSMFVWCIHWYPYDIHPYWMYLSQLSLTITLWTGKVLHSTCPSSLCYADAKNMQPPPLIHCRTFILRMRWAWRSLTSCYASFTRVRRLAPPAGPFGLFTPAAACFYSLSSPKITSL